VDGRRRGVCLGGSAFGPRGLIRCSGSAFWTPGSLASGACDRPLSSPGEDGIRDLDRNLRLVYGNLDARRSSRPPLHYAAASSRGRGYIVMRSSESGCFLRPSSITARGQPRQTPPCSSSPVPRGHESAHVLILGAGLAPRTGARWRGAHPADPQAADCRRRARPCWGRKGQALTTRPATGRSAPSAPSVPIRPRVMTHIISCRAEVGNVAGRASPALGRQGVVIVPKQLNTAS